MTDKLAQSPTSQVVPAPEFPAPGTMTIEERAQDLAERAGHVGNQTSLVGGDAAGLQHDAFRIQLDTRTARLVKQHPSELLDQLSELGFAWRDVARMVGVSVPALRRWRGGELPNGENRRAIAQLLAFAHIIRDDHLVFEPASWMEVPIIGAAPITPVDLYAAGHLDVVFDLAAEQCSPEEALDATNPGWRETYRSDWEVGMAEDGQPYIRPKPGR
ncbi:MAG: helix-turn-helix domain-containing protein [Actinomycetota bacterium]|nr:helix-turn-helix domain-containing protein [Actinomycetota bacterium]